MKTLKKYTIGLFSIFAAISTNAQTSKWQMGVEAGPSLTTIHSQNQIYPSLQSLIEFQHRDFSRILRAIQSSFSRVKISLTLVLKTSEIFKANQNNLS
jgi:hypothetical protein